MTCFSDFNLTPAWPKVSFAHSASASASSGDECTFDSLLFLEGGVESEVCDVDEDPTEPFEVGEGFERGGGDSWIGDGFAGCDEVGDLEVFGCCDISR